MSMIDFNKIWQRKWFLLLVVIGTSSAGLAYTLVTEPIYEGEASILVQPRGISSVDVAQSARYREFLATQAEILRSPLMINAALEDVQLEMLEGVEPHKNVPLVTECLQVSPVVNTDVLRIWCRSPVAGDTEKLISAIIEKYKLYIHKSERNRLSDTLELLSKNEQQLRDELLDLSQQYEALRQKNSLVGQGNDLVNVKLVALRELSGKLTETRNRQFDLEAKSQTLTPANVTSENVEPNLLAVGAVTSGETFAARPMPRQGADGQSMEPRGVYEIYRDLWQAKARASSVAKRFGPGHPAREAAIEEVNTWAKFASEHYESLTTVIRQELAASKATEKKLTELYEEKYADLKKLDNELVQEKQLLDNMARVEAAREVMMQRLRDLELANQSVAHGQSSTRLEVLRPPVAPSAALWPKPIPLIGVCGMLGLILGTAAVVFWDHFRPMIRNEPA